jgi:U3 small nucleolar RNA-associated protein 6
MVETVEQRLEQFVPTFEQLISLDIFKRHEVQAIIQRRRVFEHSLHSKNARLDAYLKYIEYETAVMQLTNQRKIERNIDSNERLLSDHDWPRHIRSIFTRATHHFSNDLSIWNLYIDFCQRTHSMKALDKAFTECIRHHGDHPEVWIRAAQWQMLDNNNVELAKSYLEHAIKRIPGNPDLYAAYAEALLYLGRQIESRRELHGIEESSDFTRAPIAVFDRALEACPQKGEVFKKFIQVFEKYEVDTKQLFEKGIESRETEVLTVIARTDADPPTRFHEFLKNEPSRELTIAFADYLCEAKRGEELAEVISTIDDFSTDESEKFADAFLNCGELDRASEFLETDLSTKRLQFLKLRLYDQQFSDCADFLRVAEPFVRRFSSAELNSDFLFFVARKIDDLSKWTEIVKQRIPLVSGDVIGSALTVSLLRFGPEAADGLLNAVMALVVPTPGFIASAIEVVKAQQFVDPQRVRSLHELNVTKWGTTNTDAWLEYAQFEYNQKELKKLEAVRWKALRELADGARFRAEYAKRFCQHT